MGRKLRQGLLDGAPGSKIKTNNLKGGLGTGLAVLEQTVLNLPLHEIDRMLDDCRKREGRFDALLDLKFDDLEKSPEQRKFVRISDIAAAQTQNFQMKQVLAGYSSRKITTEVDGTLSAIERLEGKLNTLQDVLVLVDEEIDAKKNMKALPATAQRALPAGAVLEVAPETMVAIPRKPPPTVTGRPGRELVKMGLLDKDGNGWTGKEPDMTYPKWVWRYFEWRRPDMLPRV